MQKNGAPNWQTQTLEYYNTNTDSFIAGSMPADMSDARARFLAHVPDNGYILDLGCGSGRDTKIFLEKGYAVDAVDGSAELCRRASEYAGVPVRQMLFRELDEMEKYDGIWACASLLHLPKTELKETVLPKIAAALKKNGVLYASLKYGDFEGIRNRRLFSDYTEETLAEVWQDMGSMPVFETWSTYDVRPDRGAERWINLLARRV